nr:MAG TPA: hypothetical protein [Caudoviricetes sp.]
MRTILTHFSFQVVRSYPLPTFISSESFLRRI